MNTALFVNGTVGFSENLFLVAYENIYFAIFCYEFFIPEINFTKLAYYQNTGAGYVASRNGVILKRLYTGVFGKALLHLIPASALNNICSITN